MQETGVDQATFRSSAPDPGRRKEALNNVLRHARAKNAYIELEQKPGWISLLVKDDRRGFSLKGKRTIKGLGIIGMRERAEILGGTLKIKSTPGEGTILEVNIPY